MKSLKLAFPQMALLFRRDAARLGPEVSVELPITFRRRRQAVGDRYAAQMAILTQNQLSKRPRFRYNRSATAGLPGPPLVTHKGSGCLLYVPLRFTS